MLVDRVKKLWGPKEDMNLQEALATSHGVAYKPVKKPDVQKIARVERWFWQQPSIYAAKVAMATTVYSVFALAQHVFLRIGQVSALRRQ